MAKPAPSRTYNPLHFEDLSPQRFEDLTRNLIYDFREWMSIEAVGRSGADQGVDIRATERVTYGDVPEEDEENELDAQPDIELREWVFQCKRYKRIGPKHVAAIAENDLGQQSVAPYGYVLVATSDFSHAAREAFREKMVEHGIREFYLWGKAELEDRLYQPKNDHLLFAYFGISLQTRKRSQRTQLRSDLTLKRKLVKVLGGVQERNYKSVLLRDPSDDRYPDVGPLPDDPWRLPWNYWSFEFHAVRNGLYFEVGRAQAYVDWTSGEWDYIEDDLNRDGEFQNLHDLRYGPLPVAWRRHKNYYGYWSNHVPDENKAQMVALGRIPYERILLVDELGDVCNEGPHILIEYLPGKDLVERTFGPELHWTLRSARSYDNRAIAPDDVKRAEFFPKEIPEEDLNPVLASTSSSGEG